MATYEEEYERLRPVIRRLWRVALLGKKLEVRGAGNFVLSGPNVLVGNHIGSFKDVAVLFKAAPRPIFFTANRELFDDASFQAVIRRHLERHFKEFGLTFNRLLGPLKTAFVDFVSSRIGRIGTVPVDISPGRQKGESLALVENHLRAGRAVVALQGRGRLRRMYPNPFIEPFKSGVAHIAHRLHDRDGLAVAVTPLAFLGTHRPMLIPARVRLNVGPPLYIRDYLGGNAKEAVERFRGAMEARVRALFFDLLSG
ncbi:MAG: 1-acyl-sn-glycerol-3-phosphate acyltransferase [Candidatus Aminicenantes bacterium]|nr:1-acyl-sn-glycerol-3-phosphate acyltransferase [Candidatus Aminicenantes bacterium]